MTVGCVDQLALDERAHEFFDVEGIALGVAQEQLDHRFGQLTDVDQILKQGAAVFIRQRADVDFRHQEACCGLACRGPAERLFRLWAGDHAQQHGQLPGQRDERVQHVMREIVGPVEILQNQNERAFRAEGHGPFAHCQQSQFFDLFRLQFPQGGMFSCRGPHAQNGAQVRSEVRRDVPLHLRQATGQGAQRVLEQGTENPVARALRIGQPPSLEDVGLIWG
ncbi:MAG: hypothetical protein BWY25_02490 [Chloroflexi bacterium ADurb.Bin222]|nr:MAG: hypothetical protein BWY25_02490 [Chloroflexi bacterium ADurb.Bin222]